MSRKTMLLFVGAVVTMAVWAARIFAVGVSDRISDFCGGMAIGLAIGALVAWAAERAGTVA